MSKLNKNGNIVYYKPFTQYENTGDLLICKTLLKLISFNNQVILDDSNAPSWFIKELSNQSTSLLSDRSKHTLIKTILFQLLKRKKGQSVYLIFPPGHIFRSRAVNWYIIFRAFAVYNLLKLLGCKIIRMGFSIGPFDPQNAKVERLLSHVYHTYGLRDQASLQLAKQLKIANTKYFPDFAWAYQSQIVPASVDENVIVLSFRSNNRGRVFQEDYLDLTIKSLIKLLKSIPGSFNKIIISYQVLYDREGSVKLYDEIKNQFNVEFIDKKLSLEEAEKLYSSAFAVISNRLHVLLLASQSHTLAIPLINFDDNGKIVSIYKDNDLDDLLISNQNPDIVQFNEIMDNKKTIVDRFNVRSNINERIILNRLKEIFNCLVMMPVFIV